MNMLIMWLLIPVLIMLLIGAAMAAICGFAYGLYLMVKGSMVIYSGFTEPCQGLCSPYNSPSVGGMMLIVGLLVVLLSYKSARG
ncbi:hypothetical protein OHN11_21790 [Serratia marcescens]|uniref:hypothetical protein n=1 Tax=Serratia TaxID=613 RepID=UPI001185F87B|nr:MULTISPECIES: hypothetical protein [Serratia]MDM3535922.1 hypothetical protein [Serratia marcescens]TXE56920.1 hypothetical protein FOT58_19310 [Serratia nematodiphila]